MSLVKRNARRRRRGSEISTHNFGWFEPTMDNAGNIRGEYDKDGYDSDGYDKTGFDESGFDIDGYDYYGQDADGLDSTGYDWEGNDWDGYDRDGYKEGTDRQGNDYTGESHSRRHSRMGRRALEVEIDEEDDVGIQHLSSWNAGDEYHWGYNINGLDEQGFDKHGFDGQGYDVDGKKAGESYSGARKIRAVEDDNDWIEGDEYRDGYNINGYDEEGFQDNGYNRYGLNRSGLDKNNMTGTGYDEDGYAVSGYDEWGEDRDGLNRSGYDKDGYDIDGKKGGESRRVHRRGREYFDEDEDMEIPDEGTEAAAIEDIRIMADQGWTLDEITGKLINAYGPSYDEDHIYSLAIMNDIKIPEVSTADEAYRASNPRTNDEQAIFNRAGDLLRMFPLTRNEFENEDTILNVRSLLELEFGEEYQYDSNSYTRELFARATADAWHQIRIAKGWESYRGRRRGREGDFDNQYTSYTPPKSDSYNSYMKPVPFGPSKHGPGYDNQGYDNDGMDNEGINEWGFDKDGIRAWDEDDGEAIEDTDAYIKRQEHLKHMRGKSTRWDGESYRRGRRRYSRELQYDGEPWDSNDDKMEYESEKDQLTDLKLAWKHGDMYDEMEHPLGEPDKRAGANHQMGYESAEARRYRQGLMRRRIKEAQIRKRVYEVDDTMYDEEGYDGNGYDNDGYDESGVHRSQY